MNEFLRKIFIKDYKNVSDPEVRKKHGILASIFGIITNCILFVFKLLIGLISSSVSIVTDAVNNLSDFASSIVNVFGFKLASKPADKKHPYGHERIEYIASMLIAFVIIGIAVVLLYRSIVKIINKEEADISMWSFIILSIAILIKLYQGFFYRYIAKLINSSSLKTSSIDSFSDVISTSFVLIVSIVEFTLAKNNIKLSFSLDGVVGVLLGVFIILMGIKLIIETANPLIGITPDNELIKKVINNISSYKGVLGIHDIMCHCYGPTKIFMTVHVEVDAKVNVLESHDLIDNIENEIGSRFNVILTIHMDPIDNSSKEVRKLKNDVRKIITSYSNVLSFHDFRIVKGKTHTNILFDLVVPFESDLDIKHLKEYLNKEIKSLNKNYILICKIDRDYTGK